MKAQDRLYMKTASNDKLRFLTKCLLILLPVLAVWGVAFFNPMYILDYDYALWMQQKDYIENQSDYNRVVILGDSSAQFNIDPENGWNDARILAVGAMRMPAHYYSLVNYLEKHPAPECVVLSVTYDRFYEDYDEFLVKGVGYHYLNSKEKKEILETADQVGSRLLEDVTSYEMFRYYYRTPDLFALEILRNLMEGAGGRNKDIYRETFQRKGSYAYSAPEYALTQITKSAEDCDIHIDPLMDSYLDRIVSLCGDNDIKLIIVQAPMNKTSYDKLDQHWFEQFDEMLASYDGRCIVEKEIPVYPDEYFYSSNHMNKKGVTVYTDDMMHKTELQLQKRNDQ